MPSPRKTICLIAEYPHSLMTGGLQVQAIRTLEVLREMEPEFDYRPLDWNTTRKADLYHFLNTPRYMIDVARLVKMADKPYICTLLLGHRSDFNRWWRDRTKAIFNLPSYSGCLANAASVIAITEAERRSIIRSYGVPEDKAIVVPHGVDDHFFTATDQLWKEKRGDAPFLLNVGAVQQRKNQLLLLEAANAAQIAVVLIGPVLPGRGAYAEKVEAEARINRRYGGDWIQGLDHDDPLLVSAYAASRGFTLLSNLETQPISVLQAMAARKPILLGEALYAKETPFDTLPQVNLENKKAIIQALQHLWTNGTPTQLDSSYRWREVARKLASLYRTILLA